MDPNFFICTDEAWFSLSGSVNSQNSRYYATHNLHLRNKQPLHSAKLGVWCAISGRRIITRFFRQTVNADRYIHNLFNPFVEELTEEELLYEYFEQDGATAHTASRTLSRVHDVLGVNQTVSRGSEICWPSRSPDLSPCADFYLCGKLKGQVYSNTNPQTLEALEANISNAIAALTPEELQRVFLSLIRRAEICLEASGGHFENVL